MTLVYLTLVVSLLVIPALTEPVEQNGVVNSSPSTTPSDRANHLLTGVGVRRHGTIFWENSSPTVSSCLPFVNVEDRLRQMCANHERARTCENQTEDSSSLLFDYCESSFCIGRIDTEGVYCRIFNNPNGPINDSGEIDLTCGLPDEIFQSINVWNSPTWIPTIGGEENYHCMTAFPSGTDLHWRFICVENSPQIEVRFQFPDDFLSGYYQPQCIVRDICGGSSIFTSDAICFESPRLNTSGEEDSDVEDAELLSDMDSDGASTIQCARIVLSVIVILLLCCIL
eukprot:g6995.t1